MKSRPFFIVLFFLLTAGAFLAPGTPFIVDGGIYYDMARSMAERGSLSIGSNGGVPDSPVLNKLLAFEVNGALYPQYPSGYAILAAPFYTLFGIHGLILMNAIGFGVSLWLTFSIAKRLFSLKAARLATLIFALASFAPTYMYDIWPHMVALSFGLGAIAAAVRAHDAKSYGLAIRYSILSGVLVGAAINIRVDVFLASIVVFLWFRLFARPDHRGIATASLIGLLPGLFVAALLNAAKFGAFAPFSYGDSQGADSVSKYTTVVIAAALAFSFVFLFHVPRILARLRTLPHSGFAGMLLVIIIVFAFGPARELAAAIFRGLYVLVFNLQAHNAYFQEGVGPNEYGQVLFWGYPKKALIQSIPWAPLVIVPLIAMVSDKTHRAARGLCLLAILGPLCFYALNEWHGGGSYSLRYFLPTLPFFSMLAADGLLTLLSGKSISRRTILIALTLAAVAYLGMQEAGQIFPRLRVPTALYPQWIIAGILTLAILARLATKEHPASRIVIPASLFSLAYACAINIYEEIGHERTRFEQLSLSETLSAPIPAGSLVVSPAQINLIPAERNGAFVIAATKSELENIVSAVKAFRTAGRCVYFHNSRAKDLLDGEFAGAIDPRPYWPPNNRFKNDPRLALFTFKNSPTECLSGLVNQF